MIYSYHTEMLNSKAFQMQCMFSHLVRGKYMIKKFT